MKQLKAYKNFFIDKSVGFPNIICIEDLNTS